MFESWIEDCHDIFVPKTFHKSLNTLKIKRYGGPNKVNSICRSHNLYYRYDRKITFNGLICTCYQTIVIEKVIHYLPKNLWIPMLICRFSFINKNIENQIEMSAKQKREANLGYVLVSISVLFIICQSFKIIPGNKYLFTYLYTFQI